jgi:hypothetical protein
VDAYPKAQDLPDGEDPVSVYGYSVGGSSLAVTKGAVARISYGLYNMEMGLQLQLDAALNPDNHSDSTARQSLAKSPRKGLRPSAGTIPIHRRFIGLLAPRA